MNLNKLYKMQGELDKHILEKHNIKMTKEELLDNTILALLVEVGELANTTRCFKHWSTKGMMDKEVILDELADVWHFYLSIGNQIGIGITDCFSEEHSNNTTQTFLSIYFWGRELEINNITGMGVEDAYKELGSWINILWNKLGFTNKEVEQAYLKKHEENYKRQREGY